MGSGVARSPSRVPLPCPGAWGFKRTSKRPVKVVPLLLLLSLLIEGFPQGTISPLKAPPVPPVLLQVTPASPVTPRL